jgi:hypothetical protein
MDRAKLSLATPLSVETSAAVKQTLTVTLQTTRWAPKDLFISCFIRLDATRSYRILFKAFGHHNKKNRISFRN